MSSIRQKSDKMSQIICPLAEEKGLAIMYSAPGNSIHKDLAMGIPYEANVVLQDLTLSSTHLLMNGVKIREIQNLLGHKHLETTKIYTHVLRDMVSVPRSLLDHLYIKKPH